MKKEFIITIHVEFDTDDYVPAEEFDIEDVGDMIAKEVQAEMSVGHYDIQRLSE